MSVFRLLIEDTRDELQGVQQRMAKVAKPINKQNLPVAMANVRTKMRGVINSDAEDEQEEQVSGEPKKWIAKAVGKNPGALHRKTATPQGQKIPLNKVYKLKKNAEKKGDTKTLKQVFLAKTLRKINK